jgi:hypothetical protein
MQRSVKRKILPPAPEADASDGNHMGMVCKLLGLQPTPERIDLATGLLWDNVGQQLDMLGMNLDVLKSSLFDVAEAFILLSDIVKTCRNDAVPADRPPEPRSEKA